MIWLLSFNHIYFYDRKNKKLDRHFKLGARYLSSKAPDLTDMNSKTKEENLAKEVENEN